MIRLILLTPLLCACDPNVIAGKKSEAQLYHEAVEANKQMEVQGLMFSATVEVAQVPACYPSFRVNQCDELGNEIPWYYE